MLHLDLEQADLFYSEDEFSLFESQLQAASDTLDQKTGAGSEFLGWLDLPSTMESGLLERILQTAAQIREISDILIVVGIGGSYLGARAVIDALSDPLRSMGHPKKEGIPAVVYAGHHLSGRELAAVESLIDRYDVSLNVISKSGTTTEPAIAFRRLKAKIEEKYGVKGSAERIVVTTDRSKGALRSLADEVGYESFIVPDDIGGRYSVLTPVGLLPIASAGIDIRALLSGAKAAEQQYRETDLAANDAARYAFCRNVFLRRGYAVEILVNYEPGLHYMAEWWKQLFGESEGKNGRGLFPASLDFTTDLHSLGQYVQDGRRMLFETVLDVKDTGVRVEVPEASSDLDGLNYLAGKDMAYVNGRAMTATALAHVDGGVPNLRIVLDRLDAEHIGRLLYFFERACAISGYLNAVNPFNQPGVEAYKQNMFALLGKPGYETLAAVLEARL